jgi:Mn2+/Fe2+ NRAMP family transporter
VAGRRKRNEEDADTKESFLSRLGPGLITGASDDDPSGIGTYSQAGARNWVSASAGPCS